MKRLAQENEIYDAEIAAEVDSMDEVEATGHRDGFQGALEDEQIPPCTAKPKRTQRLFLDKAKQKANAEIDKSESFDNGPSFEDSGHGIAENPSNSISQLRQNSVFVRNRNNPAGEPLEFVARFDTCADSNFISSRAAKNHGFDILPLVPADITTYEMLEGECTPDHMVTLELQYPRSPRFYTDSFRVVKNNSFDILVGSTTIEKRGIVVQQHKQGIAFPSFKKKPNDGNHPKPLAMLALCLT
jgi:hypothetical protein